MYVEPGFYDLVDGSIGTIEYKHDIGISMSEEEQQAFVDKQSNEYFKSFLNLSLDPQDAFAKARRRAWDQIENGELSQIRSILVQIGQPESIKKIKELEESAGFLSWMNPLLVESIKNHHQL